MMPQGYAGLTKRRSTREAVAVIDQASAATKPSGHFTQAKSGNLHVVELDSRRHERSELLPYGPFAPRQAGAYAVGKRTFDIVGASLAIILLSPLILVLVSCTLLSGGSPFFRHRRVGERGAFFDCIKFRTMVRNADQVLHNLLEKDPKIKEEWLRYHKLRDDPRVTRIGRFLRRTSLDELPQLWNVLRGEMSLVGPRPVVPDELRRYGRRVGVFLSARPGITGLWQISGRNDTDYRRRVALDVCYVRSRSLVLDIYIMLRTFRVVFATNGAY